jgi:hypothetical protein
MKNIRIWLSEHGIDDIGICCIGAIVSFSTATIFLILQLIATIKGV